MAELVKDIYNKEFLMKFSNIISLEYKEFKRESFLRDTLGSDWEKLEYKQRLRKITLTLGEYLPQNYDEAINILINIKDQCTGFPYMFFPDFVEVFGLEVKNYETSIKALELFTEHSSSEFAIRPFIIMYTENTMNHMKKWAKSDNEHIRRLASEGCRPRLPWAMALPIFKENPLKVLEILELLKSDESLYVRKSVANNLNDISKDNPDIVIKTVKRWLELNNEYTNWICRRACRTLVTIKNEEAMSIFGYDTNINTSETSIIVANKNVEMADISEIKYNVTLKLDKPTHIRLEYGIYFVKANGSTSLKKFLILDKTINETTTLHGVKKYSWVLRTTRKYYKGKQKIVLLINGNEIAEDYVNLL